MSPLPWDQPTNATLTNHELDVGKENERQAKIVR